jgi:peptidoglycan L-alanyl-D-glutamate endopeptidase CwlK
MTLSEADLAHLDRVDPRLANMMRYLADRGFRFRITESVRDPARQAMLYDQGASKTMNSRHLTGNAIDIAVYDENGNITWDPAAYAPIGAAAKAYAQRHGLEDFTWGGDWGWDSVHFETRDPWDGMPGLGPTVERAQAGLPLATRTPPAQDQPEPQTYPLYMRLQRGEDGTYRDKDGNEVNRNAYSRIGNHAISHDAAGLALQGISELVRRL